MAPRLVYHNFTIAPNGGKSGDCAKWTKRNNESKGDNNLRLRSHFLRKPFCRSHAHRQDWRAFGLRFYAKGDCGAFDWLELDPYNLRFSGQVQTKAPSTLAHASQSGTAVPHSTTLSRSRQAHINRHVLERAPAPLSRRCRNCMHTTRINPCRESMRVANLPGLGNPAPLLPSRSQTDLGDVQLLQDIQHADDMLIIHFVRSLDDD
jgi:hypothetical protein